MTGIGILLAFVAMIFWGFGDFMIQKSTRRIGDWETLFIISVFGAVVIFPFVWRSIPSLFMGNELSLIVLVTASLALFGAALLEFESLKRGKISVVEPSWSLEIPASAILAFFILSERISGWQIVFALLLMICLILVGLRGRISTKLLFEKGIVIALIAGIAMGVANFLMGWAGRVSDPLVTNFFVDVVLLAISGIYLLFKGQMHKLVHDIRHSYDLLIPMSLFDKIAWVAYVGSMSLAPIAIATALSESYIIPAVLLGIFVNKEKLRLHQKVGLVGAIICAIILALLTNSL